MTCPKCESTVRSLAVAGPVWYAVYKCDCTTGEGWGTEEEARSVARSLWRWKIRRMDEKEI